MPAVTGICEAVIDVVNAASLAGDFPMPVTAIERDALTLPMENSDSTKVFVQPGPLRREPGTLDGGINEMASVKLVFEASPIPCSSAVISQYLNLVELICDTIEDDIGQDYIHLSTEHDIDQPYDQDRLRNDAVLYSERTLRFSSLRYPS